MRRKSSTLRNMEISSGEMPSVFPARVINSSPAGGRGNGSGCNRRSKRATGRAKGAQIDPASVTSHHK